MGLEAEIEQPTKTCRVCRGVIREDICTWDGLYAWATSICVKDRSHWFHMGCLHEEDIPRCDICTAYLEVRKAEARERIDAIQRMPYARKTAGATKDGKGTYISVDFVSPCQASTCIEPAQGFGLWIDLNNEPQIQTAHVCHEHKDLVIEYEDYPS